MPSLDLPSSREFLTQLLDSLRAIPQPSADITNTAALNPLNSASEPLKKRLLALHVWFPNELLPALDLLDRRLVTRFRIRREQDILKDTAPQNVDVAAFSFTDTLRGHGCIESEAVAQLNDEQVLSGPTSAPNPTLTSTVGQMDSPDAEMTDAPRIIHEGASVAQGVPDEATQRTQEVDGNIAYYVRSAQQRSSRYSTSYDTTTSYEVRLKAWNCSCPAFAFSAFPPVHPEPPIPIYNSTKELDGRGAGVTGEGEHDMWNFGGLSLGNGTPPVCKHLLACVLAERCSSLFGGFVEERVVSVEEAAGWAAGWGD